MSHAPHIRLGTLACLLLTCAVAPPLVRGAESGVIDDGGGCNGKRQVQFGADSEGSGSTTEGSSSTGTSEPTTMGGGSCGDGVVEMGEGCDDGNEGEGDACPSGAKGKCLAVAGCGDGFVWSGMEGCDDGNFVGGDGCEADCTVTMAVCGTGVEESGEGCDDGNEVEEDGCPSGAVGQCKAVAGCGDGFVWAGMEACDDGNGEDLDGCNNMCAPPRWVFITSGNGPNNNGNLGGVAGADGYCQGLAVAAKLPGTYKAWLTGADAGSAPAQRFGSTGFTGWYLLSTKPPTPVARGWADLTSPNEDVLGNYLQSAIYVDEKGNLLGDANVWTNTQVDGTQKDPVNHCTSWSTDSGDSNGLVGRGKPAVIDATWTNNKQIDCASGARLYCFQTE